MLGHFVRVGRLVLETAEAMNPRDQLPPEHGPRHRDYDIALAAALTAERLSYYVMFLSAAALWPFGWYIAIPGGYLALYLIERPYKRRLAAAWDAREAESKRWDDDR